MTICHGGKAPLKIALIGNPNSGKTTLFNILTDSDQTVGNWPGVTVEKKQGRLVNDRSVFICDLPGVYSLTPYTSEEIIVRQYFENERPDLILNIIDVCSIERSLYLTSQILDLRIPTVIVLNMMDIFKRSGKSINTYALSELLGCETVEISALNKTGIQQLKKIINKNPKKNKERLHFDTITEKALKDIESYLTACPVYLKRWYSIRLLEHDLTAVNALSLNSRIIKAIEYISKETEQTFNDSCENALALQRYKTVEQIHDRCIKSNKNKKTVTDKLDNILTNKYLAFPIFICVMFIIYSLALGGLGQKASDFITDGLFDNGWFLFGIGEDSYKKDVEIYNEKAAVIKYYKTSDNSRSEYANIYVYDNNGNYIKKIAATRQDYEKALQSLPPDPKNYGFWIPGLKTLTEKFLTAIKCSEQINMLITDGILSGVGTVVGFLPQISILFFCLSILESCGYMTRIAFITDRLFSRFGLTGKSFIPIIVGTGCGVPGVLASRTLESGKNKFITISTTTFMPCSAKLPLITLICSAFFRHKMLAAVSIYIISILSIILSAVILRSFKFLPESNTPFIMEMPDYHLPKISNVFKDVKQRVLSFLTRAATVIVLASILIWLLSNYRLMNGSVIKCQLNDSFLASLGKSVAFVFRPLGWGDWRFAVSAVSGIIAKENTVSTLGILFGNSELSTVLVKTLSTNAAFSFAVFNVLCVPCAAAVSAIFRELNSLKYGTFTVCYQCCFAYLAALCVYKLSFLTLPVMIITVFLASKPKK